MPTRVMSAFQGRSTLALTMAAGAVVLMGGATGAPGGGRRPGCTRAVHEDRTVTGLPSGASGARLPAWPRQLRRGGAFEVEQSYDPPAMAAVGAEQLESKTERTKYT